MTTNCKIGKITLKETGATLRKVNGTNLTLIEPSTDKCVPYSIELLRQELRTGEVAAVGLVILKKNGTVKTEFDVDAGTYANGLLGGIERLKVSIFDWLKEA